MTKVSDVHTQGLLETASTGVIDSSIDICEEDENESSVNEEDLLELPEFKGKETIADVRNNPDLSLTQTEEIKMLLREFEDVSTDFPGEQNS